MNRTIMIMVLVCGVLGCDGAGVYVQPEELTAEAAVCECAAPPPAAEPVDLRMYTRTADAPALPGEEGRAVATCDPGDVVVTGGCTWGKSPGTVDPISFGPTADGAGWECRGLAREDAGNHAPTYAVAVCAVAP